jgi:hypothetical protein
MKGKAPPEPAEAESVVPISVRFDPIVRVLMGEVPFPMSIPVRVVEPVPPLLTARAFSNVRVPMLANCEKRFVDEAIVEKRSVVVALASVVLPLT